jgi:D-sedoheptulose 7-phosphate isomerase
MIEQRLYEHIAMVQKMIRSEAGKIDKAARLTAECLARGGGVYIFGNGGSAADAQHFAGELAGKYLQERKPLNVRALTVDSSVLTAIGNDYGFEGIFARQVRAHARKEDVLIGISTSGKSENVIRALQAGREIGTTNIGMTGGNGVQHMEGLCDALIVVQSIDTPRIQEGHEFAYHLICELVEKRFVE